MPSQNKNDALSPGLPLQSGEDIGRVTYIPSADGLRFVAFLLVFFSHMSIGGDWRLLGAVASRGWIGVEIFFALSAFLLFILLQEEKIKYGDISIAKFYTRRAYRIYPLMIFSSVAFVFLFGHRGDDWIQRLAGIAIGVDNFLSWIKGYNQSVPYTAHFWTLSYELQIYLIIPLVFLAFQRLRHRQIVMVLLGIEVFALIARWIFATLGAPHPIIWVTPFLRPESTLLGISIAIFHTRLPSTLLAGIIGVAFALLVLGPSGDVMGNWTVVAYILAGAVSGSALLLALGSNIVKLVLSTKAIVFLGRISFGLYVYHLVCLGVSGQLVSRFYPNDPLIPAWIAADALALTLTIIVSMASYFLLERPFLLLKERISPIHSRAP